MLARTADLRGEAAACWIGHEQESPLTLLIPCNSWNLLAEKEPKFCGLCLEDIYQVTNLLAHIVKIDELNIGPGIHEGRSSSGPG